MAGKSITYNGAHIIQEGMPLSNYMGSEQDNVKYQPDMDQGDGDYVNATFTNTHQPMESNDVEWKKVEVNYTRNSTKGYNLFLPNQANCCEDGTTSGFWAIGSTLSADSANAYIGDYCLKCVTPNVVINEGFGTDIVSIKPGLKYSVTIRMKGSGTVYIQLLSRNEAGTIVNSASSATVTLSSTWTKISLSLQTTSESFISIKIMTSTKQSATIYVDNLMLNVGEQDPTWIEGNDGSYYHKLSLYGIMHDGEPELIAEHIDTLPLATSTNESVIFDLSSGAGEPPLIKDTRTTVASLVRLELPMTLANYESIIMKHSPYDEWTKTKIIPVTGPSDYSGGYSSYVFKTDISYESLMNSDYSDLRFGVWDGTQFADCRYYIAYYTSSYATVFVEIPTVQKSILQYIYMFYGNPDALTTSNPDIIYYYDNFEDGLYTGRTSPFRNYALTNGTASIASSGQISGNYSIKHVGNGGGNQCSLQFGESNNSYIIEFDFKLFAQGSGGYDPQINLFYIQYVDFQNWLRLDTYWNGTNQIVRLTKMVSGAQTNVASWTTPSWNRKMLAGEQHHYKIICNGTSVSVFVDSTRIINSVTPSTGLTSITKGFGCVQSATGIWDNIIIRRYMSNFVGMGLECTVDTITSEGVDISPDSWDDTQQYLLFTPSSDYLSNCMHCFDIKEVEGDVYETQDVPLVLGTVYREGFDHTAKYHAIRVVEESSLNSTDSVTWNYIKYDYEILG
jgi:hypothetical protein